MSSPSLLDVRIGSVEAPAGYGKTQAIVDLVAACGERLLLLTHTNAGVQALRDRLDRADVPPGRYAVATIDAWSQRLVSAFPGRAEYSLRDAPEPNYPKIRQAAIRVIASGALDQALKVRFGGVLIDEYQDCDASQHALTMLLSSLLPVRVFGDHLQSIFDFGGDAIPLWGDVVSVFPVIERLEKPWRWCRPGASAELGEWLHAVRKCLEQGQAVDLASAPGCVKTVAGGDWEVRQNVIADVRRRDEGKTLVIAPSERTGARQKFARLHPGVTVVERADLPDLSPFIRRLVDGGAEAQLVSTAEFAADVMTGVKTKHILHRLNTILADRHRSPPTLAELAALAFLKIPSPSALAGVLDELNRQRGARVIRHELLNAALETLRLSSSFEKLPSNLERVRNQRRFAPRRTGRIAVGSTLLLKGLEAEHVVILDAAALADVRHLYVALTRGSKSLTIIGRNRWLTA